MPPASARSHYTVLQRLHALLVASVRRAWQRMDPQADWDDQYGSDVGPKISALVVAAQIASTRDSDSYVSRILDELHLTGGRGAQASQRVLRPDGIAGWAGDGRPVETLFGLLPSVAGRAYNARRYAEPEVPGEVLDTAMMAREALAEGQSFLDTITQTVVADTARAAEKAAMAQRPWVDGWVRMVVPPCCSRCAVLAGRFYLMTDGFERHPNCKCVHVPAREADHAGLTINPGRLFDSLGRAEQDRTFTVAGAEAIRLGADIGKVVNARRGMSTAQRTGSSRWPAKGQLIRQNGVFTTTEGTATRPRGSQGYVRLMPESILELASDRDEAIRLLTQFGYFT